MPTTYDVTPTTVAMPTFFQSMRFLTLKMGIFLFLVLLMGSLPQVVLSSSSSARMNEQAPANHRRMGKSLSSSSSSSSSGLFGDGSKQQQQQSETSSSKWSNVLLLQPFGGDVELSSVAAADFI